MGNNRHGFARSWVPKAGLALGTATLIFFMALVVGSVLGYQVPCQSAYLVNIVLSLGAALATAFLAGNASVTGKLPLPVLSDSPLAVSASGGIAVLVAMLMLTQNLGPSSSDCGGDVTLSCPTGMQPYIATSLGFGFCYPRAGWELDDKALAKEAADIYVRQSENNSVGIHFHVSVIPQSFIGRAEDYAERTAETWRQVDGQLSYRQDAIGGVPVYEFALRIRHSEGRQGPMEVTHLYMDDELLLEIFLAWFDDTEDSTVRTLRQVKSSLSLLN